MRSVRNGATYNRSHNAKRMHREECRATHPACSGERGSNPRPTRSERVSVPSAHEQPLVGVRTQIFEYRAVLTLFKDMEKDVHAQDNPRVDAQPPRRIRAYERPDWSCPPVLPEDGIGQIDAQILRTVPALPERQVPTTYVENVVECLHVVVNHGPFPGPHGTDTPRSARPSRPIPGLPVLGGRPSWSLCGVRMHLPSRTSRGDMKVATRDLSRATVRRISSLTFPYAVANRFQRTARATFIFH